MKQHRRGLIVLAISLFIISSRLPSTRQAGPSGPASADLVSNNADPNGFPINPHWGIQASLPGKLPSIPELCRLWPPDAPRTVAEYFGNKGCTTQLHRITIDTAGPGLYGDGCRWQSRQRPRFSGHMNWFAVTINGEGSWHNIETDHDVNLFLAPDADSSILSPGLTSTLAHASLRERPAYKLEFDVREVFDAIENSGAASPLWKTILSKPQTRKRLLTGKRYVALGLYGLDAQHGYHAEIHPVWALAVRVSEDAGADTWVIFARNSGNEGGCSLHVPHKLELPAGQNELILDLPVRPGMAGIRPQGLFHNIFGDEVDAKPTPIGVTGADRRVRVYFPLPTRSGNGIQIIHGEVRVSYQ